VPTWFYGHEPTNLFCTHVAKYFSNALREDGLLAIAKHGVVYAPGGPGTIQEIFMDACQNHYGTFDDVSPMVFLGEQFWRTTKPVYPLLEQLARGAQYHEMIGICDKPDDVVSFLKEHPPIPYAR
jgi:predicted Rossmann-fold nucleotide-binding protein